MEYWKYTHETAKGLSEKEWLVTQVVLELGAFEVSLVNVENKNETMRLAYTNSHPNTPYFYCLSRSGANLNEAKTRVRFECMPEKSVPKPVLVSDWLLVKHY